MFVYISREGDLDLILNVKLKDVTFSILKEIFQYVVCDPTYVTVEFKVTTTVNLGRVYLIQ